MSKKNSLELSNLPFVIKSTRYERSDSSCYYSTSATGVKMVLLDNSTFIIRLEKLANAAKKDSSFTVTFKRFDGHNKPKPREGRPPLPPPTVYSCLMRAQHKSKKISTIVQQDDVPKMMSMYAQFMKSNMDGLKRVKKVKSKTKSAKG